MRQAHLPSCSFSILTACAGLWPSSASSVDSVCQLFSSGHDCFISAPYRQAEMSRSSSQSAVFCGESERWGLLAFLCALEVTASVELLTCIKVSCLSVLKTSKIEISSIITVSYKVLLVLLLRTRQGAKQLRCWRTPPAHQESSLHQGRPPCLQVEAQRSLDGVELLLSSFQFLFSSSQCALQALLLLSAPKAMSCCI